MMKDIKDQFDAMLQRGTMPMFGIDLGNDEYFIVDLGIHTDDRCAANSGVTFEFDDSKPTYFDGAIKNKGGGVYILPYDKYVDDLHTYLETIMGNITEGYLIPNNLYI